jgi:hypothetical protein
VLLGGWRLARGGGDASSEAGDDLALAIDAEAPFLAVDAVARLVHGRPVDEATEAYAAVGAWLTATGQPAALQLLKAVWVEAALREDHP